MRAVVFLASLVIAAPSMAQPQLLVELRNAMMACGDCRPIDMRIAFAGWSQPVTQNDVGTTFTMPADLLDDVTFLTTGFDFALSVTLDSIGPGGPELVGYIPPDIFTNGSLINNPQVIRHAPILGPNLTGYTISGITQTLHSLDIIQQSSTRYLLNATSTLHIYGAAIPEPSTLVLFVFAHCALRVRLLRR